jgi:ribosome-associated protein
VAGEDLPVRGRLVIPAAELRESASRSSGPGGQHVNKTSTKVTLRWSPAGSAALGPLQRERLLERLAERLTRSGDLVVHAQRFRSRSRNRALARERLAGLVREALAERRPRQATRPGRAAREERLSAKRRRSEAKRRRRRTGLEAE